MGLPKKTLLVLPNPWTMIHPEHGPVGFCTRDTGGRGGDVIYIGAEIKAEVTEKREGADGRASRQLTWFDYPGLDASLTKGKGIVVPKTDYYFDRLRDGGLIPADDETKKFGHRFASLEEAKKNAVEAFDAEHGEGSWKELEQLLADEAKAEAEAAAKLAKAAESATEKTRVENQKPTPSGDGAKK